VKCLLEVSSLVMQVDSSPINWLWAFRQPVSGFSWVLRIAREKSCGPWCKPKQNRNPLNSRKVLVLNRVERGFPFFRNNVRCSPKGSCQCDGRRGEQSGLEQSQAEEKPKSYSSWAQVNTKYNVCIRSVHWNCEGKSLFVIAKALGK
jgi:hypothetical protein